MEWLFIINYDQEGSTSSRRRRSTSSLSADEISDYVSEYIQDFVDELDDVTDLFTYNFESMSSNLNLRTTLLNLQVGVGSSFLDSSNSYSLYFGQYYVFDGLYTVGSYDSATISQTDLETEFGLDASDLDDFFTQYTSAYSVQHELESYLSNYGIGDDTISTIVSGYDFTTFTGFNVYESLNVTSLISQMAADADSEFDEATVTSDLEARNFFQFQLICLKKLLNHSQFCSWLWFWQIDIFY